MVIKTECNCVYPLRQRKCTENKTDGTMGQIGIWLHGGDNLGRKRLSYGIRYAPFKGVVGLR